MRVIFTGQPGIKKASAIRQLIKQAEPAVGTIEPLCVEDKIKGIFLDIVPFLEESSRLAREDTWKKAMQDVLKDIRNSAAQHFFLEMHGLFNRKGRWFCPVDLGLIQKFKPTA